MKLAYLLTGAILALSTASADAQTIKIKVANYFAPSHPQNVALREKFKPLLEQSSGGKISVQIYDNAQLGGEQQFYTAVRNGTVEMALSGGLMQNDVPQIGTLEWPFVFRDLPHAKKVLLGDIGKELAAELERVHGVHVVTWTVNGISRFSSSKPINKMEDFKGLRMRMPTSQSLIRTGQSLGATVVAMPLTEVFTALEQKIVDAQSNPLATIRHSGFYEVQSYILDSKHIFSPTIVLISQKLWKSLDPEQKKLIESAAAAYAEFEWTLAEQADIDDRAFLEEKKLKFITPDETFRKQMEAAVQPMHEEYYAKYPWARDLVTRIKAVQ